MKPTHCQCRCLCTAPLVAAGNSAGMGTASVFTRDFCGHCARGKYKPGGKHGVKLYSPGTTALLADVMRGN